ARDQVIGFVREHLREVEERREERAPELLIHQPPSALSRSRAFSEAPMSRRKETWVEKRKGTVMRSCTPSCMTWKTMVKPAFTVVDPGKSWTSATFTAISKGPAKAGPPGTMIPITRIPFKTMAALKGRSRWKARKRIQTLSAASTQ